MVLCFAATVVPEESQKVSAGDIITFGHYEQDNNLDNGPEPIEWIVLDVQNGKALLLSKYGLEMKQYNDELTKVTWETCTLRAWLNNDFLNEAFSADEQASVLITEVDNSGLQSLRVGVDGGNNTKDRIFLLSNAEAIQYLGVTSNDYKNMKSRVAPTEFAIANGAYTYIQKTEDGSAAGWWWLRSPGDFQNYAAFVREDGSYDDTYVSGYPGGKVARPAFWLDLESGIF